MSQIPEVIRESRELERAQRYSDALRLLHKARREHRDDRALAIRHGELLETLKQPRQALGLYRRLFDERPDTQEAELLLGMVRALVQIEEFGQAEGLIAQILAKTSAHPDLLTARSVCHRHAGRNDAAESDARAAMRLDPAHRSARHALAEALIALGRDEEAVAELERNVLREDLHGDSIDLWLATLKRLGRDRYTQDKLEEMIARFPAKVEFVFAHAVLAHRAGEVSLARPSMEAADRLSPNNYRILHEWGVLERTAGNTELSQQLLGRSLALQPEQPAALRTFGSEHKYVYGDPEFKRLNFAASKLTELTSLEQVQMHYALAKAFEDVDELDTAFRHYGFAGQKKRRLEPYDEKAAESMLDGMRNVITAATVAERSQPGCDSELPVFILGMPRSGTSLLEQILSSHPDVFGAGELKFLGGVLDNIQIGSRRIGLRNPEPVFPVAQNASWRDRGQAYVDRLRKLAGDGHARVIDKMPGNFALVGMIHAVLPKARIIHSRRHPMETCLSNYRIHFGEGQLWSYNLRDLGRYYRRYWELMAHWRREFPGVMHEVRYEDNVADVEGEARRLIAHLGLPWNDACLEFYNTDRPVRTASATQVRKPIYTTSMNRWRKYEKYLSPLYDEIADIVEAYEAELEQSAEARDHSGDALAESGSEQ